MGYDGWYGNRFKDRRREYTIPTSFTVPGGVAALTASVDKPKAYRQPGISVSVLLRLTPQMSSSLIVSGYSTDAGVGNALYQCTYAFFSSIDCWVCIDPLSATRGVSREKGVESRAIVIVQCRSRSQKSRANLRKGGRKPPKGKRKWRRKRTDVMDPSLTLVIRLPSE